MRLAKGMQPTQKGLQFFALGMTQGLCGDGLNCRECVLDAVPALIQQQFLGVLGALPLMFGTHALECEPELSGNGDGDVDFRFCESMGCRMVGHKLADEASVRTEGDEGSRRDLLSFDGGFERSI